MRRGIHPFLGVAATALVMAGCGDDGGGNPPPTITLDLGQGVTMEMIYIKPGRFTMGSPASEAGRGNDETQHGVTITKGFYLGKYEVTQAQYQAVTGANPSTWKEPNRPVECVSWNDATEFCNRLSQRVGKQVRLPTEAEWEYACRAGSTTRFCFGDSDGGLGEYAWFSSNSGGQTHAVGGRTPNAWGLYDMHGNVWEWCSDWHGNYGGDATDPTGPASGRARALRGGSWDNGPQNCRSANRNRNEPANRNDNNGFRVAVSLSPAPLRPRASIPAVARRPRRRKVEGSRDRPCVGGVVRPVGQNAPGPARAGRPSGSNVLAGSSPFPPQGKPSEADRHTVSPAAKERVPVHGAGAASRRT